MQTRGITMLSGHTKQQDRQTLQQVLKTAESKISASHPFTEIHLTITQNTLSYEVVKYRI